MAMPQETTASDAFYDAVANEYNAHMTGRDRKAREIISAKFSGLVKSGNVLDFGGGTGLDLPWLCSNCLYRVFFLETSDNMRHVARTSLTSVADADRIVFAEHHMNFSNWAASTLPFTEKMDGVLANFAVLNSIPNLGVFFEKMALLCNKNAVLFLTVLNPSPVAVFKKYPFKLAMGYLFGKKLAVANNYNGVKHATNIHSLTATRSASANWFNYVSCNPVPFSDFAAVVLVKK